MTAVCVFRRQLHLSEWFGRTSRGHTGINEEQHENRKSVSLLRGLFVVGSPAYGSVLNMQNRPTRSRDSFNKLFGGASKVRLPSPTAHSKEYSVGARSHVAGLQKVTYRRNMSVLGACLFCRQTTKAQEQTIVGTRE